MTQDNYSQRINALREQGYSMKQAKTLVIKEDLIRDIHNASENFQFRKILLKMLDLIS